MTNYSNNRPGNNIKDGHPDRPRTKAQQEADDELWEDAGFENLGAPRITYTDLNITFEVSPGIITDDTGTRAGLVARCPQKEILFPYTTPAADIATALDAEICEMMRHDDAIDDQPIDWQPVGPEIDIDDFMTGGRWVRS